MTSPTGWISLAVLILVVGLFVAGARTRDRAMVRARLFALAFLLMGANGLGWDALRYRDAGESYEELRVLDRQVSASSMSTAERLRLEERAADLRDPGPDYLSLILHASLLLFGLAGLVRPGWDMNKEQRLAADVQEAVAKGRRIQTASGTGTTA